MNSPNCATSSRHPAVFIDRDGTLCEEVDYLDSPDKVRLISGAAQAIKFLNEHQVFVILVTNQSGIARGYFNENTLASIHERLRLLLTNEGAHLDAIYYCPHHPKGLPPYNVSCDCRKPKPGLIEEALRDFPISMKYSAVIGDKLSDTQCGMTIGIESVLVRTGYGIEQAGQGTIDKDYTHISDGLSDAVKYLSKTLLKDIIDGTSKRQI